ncbi:MAG: ABC transporter permease [Dehalococcoidia bacterium]|nr:ABC transporter permease [Dehalococcoidia bacterium]
MYGNFENSGRLVRFIFRRERVVSTIWIVGLLLFSVILAFSMGSMFDDAARQALAETLKNPGIIAMMGPVYGADNYTAGAMYSNTMLLWVIMAVAVMNILFVVRHTRADEEKGRAELVRSLPSGRMSNLNATMISAVVINAVLALSVGVGLAVAGDESMGFIGSMLYGAVLGMSGLFFAAIAALFAQLSPSSGGAMGYSFSSLGIFYIMRAAGDMNSEVLSLISPLGIAQRSQIYAGNYWWPVLILLFEAVVVAAISYKLNSIRDMDQGFIHAKPGRKEASATLLSSFGLSFRLLRNMLIVWLIVMFLLGASYGSILGDIDTFIKESEFYQQLIGVNDQYSTVTMFAAMVNSMMSFICLVPLLMIAMKARSEEKDGHAEHSLTRGISRTKYLAGFTVLSCAASILLQCAMAGGLYVVASSVLPDPSELSLGFLLQASLVYLPALWIMTSIAILLTGLWPKATNAIWGYYGFSFLMIFIERFMDIPVWIMKLVPFSYIPQLPTDAINYVTLAVLTVIATTLAAIGFVFYRKRDLVS